MKHVSLAPVTLFTLFLTALLLPASGWFTGRSSARPPSRLESFTRARERDLASPAACRHRSGQPVHWRSLLLHH